MCKRGAIVLTPFPFTDSTGSKVRPAVVVSNGATGDDVTVVFVTSQSRLKAPHLVPISPDKDNGLKTKSYIVCSKLATLETKIIIGELGHVSEDAQKKVDTALRSVLAL